MDFAFKKKKKNNTSPYFVISLFYFTRSKLTQFHDYYSLSYGIIVSSLRIFHRRINNFKNNLIFNIITGFDIQDFIIGSCPIWSKELTIVTAKRIYVEMCLNRRRLWNRLSNWLLITVNWSLVSQRDTVGLRYGLSGIYRIDVCNTFISCFRSHNVWLYRINRRYI